MVVRISGRRLGGRSRSIRHGRTQIITAPEVPAGMSAQDDLQHGTATRAPTLNEPGSNGPRRVLFVYAWLAGGGEETEVLLLARTLDPRRYRIEVVGCFRKEGMSEQTHAQLEALGVPVDRTPYTLSFEDAIAYLAEKMAGYDLIVTSQAVPTAYPALARMPRRPPLIEHAGLVSEALDPPKHWTARSVGVCRTIREAAASRMPERPQHAVEIPSMVDLSEFDSAQRSGVRAELGAPEEVPLVGWIGRLERKKHAEDFIAAAALVRRVRPEARFVIVGGSCAFMPAYADELHAQATRLGLDGALAFLGGRSDVPRLLSGFDVLVWLSENEGMPHIISEAGAAGVAVVATRDNGSEQQIVDGETGLFVPHADPPAVAAGLVRLIGDPDLRRRLGLALQMKVRREYSADELAQRWEMLFDEVIAEHRP